MDLGIRGETALVVGASYGIGFESAKALACEGARVLIAARSEANLAKAAADIAAASGQAPPAFAADVTREQDVAALAKWAAAEAPSLDMLITAVGGSQRSSFAALTDEDWQRNYDFNVMSAVRLVRAFLPALRKARKPGGGAAGRIVLLGAAAAKMPYPNQIVSNVHKAGLLALTKTLAAELAPDGIRVNLVAPGRTLTPLWINRAADMAKKDGRSPEAVIEEFSHEIPMRRFGRPEETAQAVLFLASHAASYITGQALNVDGGIARGLL
ncbi:MAG: SDR family oxidoreductase [Alphaproteobacteria bacterium]|nr:SDR family oxidoreductase [Alphaproteobacteria bacterium]